MKVVSERKENIVQSATQGFFGDSVNQNNIVQNLQSDLHSFSLIFAVFAVG